MTAKNRILVVDDETNARNALAELLKEDGYGVETAADGFKALAKIDDFAPDLVLSDLKMPGMDGITLLEKIRAKDQEIAVIVMTAHGAVETAVNAMQKGAVSYLSKPINMEELSVLITRALERRRLRAETGLLRERLADKHRIGNIIGSSAPMQQVFDTILQVAPSRASVLITGESGTGKELVAAALHEHSSRVNGPFIKLHCAALAETLLESELFGHERGAFTGAVARRDGRFQQADGGTLFLDEIGEISPAIQVKLLRFLQEHEFERVGGNQTLKVDVRIVAATNRDLKKRVSEGAFREDLYYRLNVVSVEVPPLRQRQNDIPILAVHFLHKYAKENNRSIIGFDDEALRLLSQYDWPGNVRELENAVERAVVVSRDALIGPQNLPNGLLRQVGRDGDFPPVPGSTLEEVERYVILKTLEYVGGSTVAAAQILGISPRKIQYKMHEYEAGSAKVSAVQKSSAVQAK